MHITNIGAESLRGCNKYSHIQDSVGASALQDIKDVGPYSQLEIGYVSASKVLQMWYYLSS